MRHHLVLVLLVGFALAAALAPTRAQDGPGHDGPDVASISMAAKEAGLPLVTVRCTDGHCEVILRPAATKEQVADARAIEQAADAGLEVLVLRGQPLLLRRSPPLSVVDALAVLQVDPDDRPARVVVEEHVARLRDRK